MADDQLDGSVFRRLYEGFTSAFENDNNDALADLHAPEAVMIGPAGNVLTGRDAIIEFLQRAQRIQSVRFDATDTRRLGDDMVRQVGDLTLTIRGQSRETRSVAASFLVLWAKRDAGWQIDTCVWSRRPDPAARAGGRGMGGGGRMGGGGGRGAGRRDAADVDASSEMGEGGTVARRGSRPGRDGEGAFNPRNLYRDDAPLIQRLD